MHRLSFIILTIIAVAALFFVNGLVNNKHNTLDKMSQAIEKNMEYQPSNYNLNVYALISENNSIIRDTINNTRKLIYEAIKYKKRLNFRKAINSLLKVYQLSSTKNDRILLQEIELALLELKIYNKQFDVLDLNYDEPDWQNLTFYQKSFFLRKNLLLAKYYAKTSQIYESFSKTYFNLYLLTTNSEADKFPLQYANSLALISEICINEEDEYLRLGEILGKKAIQIFHNLMYNDKASIAYANLANIELRKDKFDAAKIYLKLALSLGNNSSLALFYTNLNLGYFYKLKNQKNQALWHFKKSLSYLYLGSNSRLKANTCHFISNIYADSEMEKDSAKKYLLLALDTVNFEKYEKDWIDFIVWPTKYKLKLREEGINRNKNLLNLLLEKRKLFSKLFIGEEEFHLDDIYVENATQIIDLIIQEKIEPNLEISGMLLNILQDTKAREIKNKMYKDNKSLGIEDNQKLQNIRDKINKRLTLVNDFKDTLNYGNTAYRDLYNLYNERNRLKSHFNSKRIYNFKQNVAVNILEFSKSHQILDILFYLDNYYFTYINNGKIRVGKVDTAKINSWLKKYYKIVYGKQFYNGVGFDELLHLDINTDKEMIILPDEKLNYLPFETLKGFPKDITYHYDFSALGIGTKVFLNKSNTAVFSYSDEQSLKNVEKIKYAELKSGLEECFMLHSMLGSETKLYKGETFTKASFERSLQSDIIHISSHAEAVPNMRQHCYFLMRKGKEPEKYYGSDLPDVAPFPKFVCLNACETGMGSHITGQGTYSLSRSFLAKGTKAVLKTLWKIDDKVSKELMVRFYKNWLEGLSAGDALRMSKQDIKLKYPHPYYWAGFVLEGNPNLYLK